jgi:hypothetical protein
LRARSVEIVCVADSNPSRHGSTFEGAPVISPADLLVQDMDAIAVASIPYRHEIFEQLEALGFRHGRDFDVVSVPMETPDAIRGRPLARTGSQNHAGRL